MSKNAAENDCRGARLGVPAVLLGGLEPIRPACRREEVLYDFAESLSQLRDRGFASRPDDDP